jgi:hypothetical protein
MNMDKTSSTGGLPFKGPEELRNFFDYIEAHQGPTAMTVGSAQDLFVDWRAEYDRRLEHYGEDPEDYV